MHFALRAAVDITGARCTCNTSRRDEFLSFSLSFSFFLAVITLGDDSVVIVVIPVVQRILID